MRAWPFLCVNYVLQYVNGHAGRLRVYVYGMNVSCKGLLIGFWRDCLFSFGSIFCTGLALAWALRQGAWLLAYAILKTTANAAVSLSMQVEKALARLRKCLCSKTQICLLVSSIDNFCKQIGTRPGRTKGRAWAVPKLFDSLMLNLIEFFEKVNQHAIKRRSQLS